MKKIIITLLAITILCQSNVCLAQDFASFPIKEQYDKHQQTLVLNGSLNPCNVNHEPCAISNNYGDGNAFILESYIKMYETTGDKAYLLKFVLDAICMQEHRRDFVGIEYTPSWGGYCCDGNKCLYHDGNIIWAMSHFIYIIKGEFGQTRPGIYNEPLPQLDEIVKAEGQAFFNHYWPTYGDFAEWLQILAEQTLDTYTYGSVNWWGDDTRCYLPTPDHTDRAAQVNLQSGFACALYYFWLTDHGHTDYYDKAISIASAYKGTYCVEIPDILGCLGHYHDYLDVLGISNSSYLWKHNGWRQQNCSEYGGTNDYEDMSHAALTMQFPRAINNKLETGGIKYFDDDDMTLFRNTFLFNIYAGEDENGCPQFHPGIDGNDDINYRTEFNGLNSLKTTSLAWMPFYKYDTYNPPFNVYDIVMKYYTHDILNNINNIVYGNEFLGLSEVVLAQWDKECENLTLYNRDVIYDQDFTVNNKLEVAPQRDGDVNYTLEPFADYKTYDGQTTFHDDGATNRFVIQTGKTVNMIAGESITLLPGFVAESGSNFSASINSSICTDGLKLSNYSFSEIHKEQLNINSRIRNEFDLTIYPNPTSGKFSIEYSFEASASTTLAVFNTIGEIVMQKKGDLPREIDLTGKPQGIYMIKVVDGENVYFKKLIIQ